jgi:glycosyltransferase involved in cell wall biosynthesis
LPQYAEDLFNEIQCTAHHDTDKFNFVFAGNIGHMQSVDTIIRAAGELKDKKNIIFHIVGDGSELQNCKDLCKQLSLSQTVIFYGRKPVSEMPQFYNMADAMLITLKADKIISYTLPGKLQSYMAAGKPVPEILEALKNEALKIHREDMDMCLMISKYGLELVKDV